MSPVERMGLLFTLRQEIESERLRELARLIVTGDIQALITFAADVDRQHRSPSCHKWIIWDRTRHINDSAMQESVNNMPLSSQVAMDWSENSPNLTPEEIDYNRLFLFKVFQIITDYITECRLDMTSGILDVRSSERADSDMRYLIGIAAQRFGGDEQAISIDVARLVELNEMVYEFEMFMMKRVLDSTGHDATVRIWDAERASLLAANPFQQLPQLPVHAIMIIRPYLQPGLIHQLGQTSRIVNGLTILWSREYITRCARRYRRGRQYNRTHNERMLRWVIARWCQTTRPRTNEFLRMGIPPSWNRPDEMQRRIEMMQRSMSIEIVNDAYEEMFDIITTSTHLCRHRMYDPDDVTDDEMPGLTVLLPDPRSSHIELIEARYFIQAPIHLTRVGAPYA